MGYGLLAFFRYDIRLGHNEWYSVHIKNSS